MFTGIITDMGEVTSIDKSGDWKIRIRTSFNMDHEAIGASIACSGVCLTVVEKTTNEFLVQVSEETLSKTGIDQWQVGTKINLEQSLKLGDELGGHLVFGHVDGLAEIISITPVNDSHEVLVALPEEMMHLVAPKGSIALDGTSLTVNHVKENHVYLNIIPHTWDVTSFGTIKVGQKLHVELDMLARYVMRGFHEILHHNRQLQTAKDWDASLTRRFFIALMIYAVTCISGVMVGIEGWYAIACVPAAGYLLGCLVLPFLKKIYIANSMHKGI